MVLDSSGDMQGINNQICFVNPFLTKGGRQLASTAKYVDEFRKFQPLDFKSSNLGPQNCKAETSIPHCALAEFLIHRNYKKQ